MNALRLIFLAGFALALTNCATNESKGPTLMSPSQYHVTYEIDQVHDEAISGYDRTQILPNDVARLLSDVSGMTP